MNKAPKLRLYDRLANWFNPLDPIEIQLIEQDIATHREYERLFAAEAEKIELENRKLKAEVALIEEANERERRSAKPFVNVGLMGFRLEYKKNGVPTKAKACVTLQQNGNGQRQVVFEIVSVDTGRTLGNSVANMTKDFLQTNFSYKKYVMPWLQGVLDNADMAALDIIKIKERDHIVDYLDMIITTNDIGGK